MKIVEKIKESFEPKVTLLDLFTEAADEIALILQHLYTTITGLCDHDAETVEKYTSLTVKVQLQLRQHYDSIIGMMYTRETMVFSREDRHFIIHTLREIGDMAELIVRRISTYDPQIEPEIAEILSTGTIKIKDVGYLLKDLVNFLFKNFEKAYPITSQIHTIRRELWSYEFDFLKKLYNAGLSPQKLIFYEILVQNLRRCMKKAVDFGEGSRRLILKYSL